MKKPQHELFAAEVAKGCSYRQAALRAGYTEKGAQSTGSRLSKVPAIKQRIKDLMGSEAEGRTIRDLQRELRSQRKSVVFVVVPAA